jgi:thymidylate synthase ThyX
MFKVKIVADSKNEFDNRATTFVVTFPRIVLAELNTHRMLSKNSASSRAIPFLKMLESVKNRPFRPLRWMKEHKGMQGTEYFTSADDPSQEISILDSINYTWDQAKNAMIKYSQELSDLGVTKQICNRLLEPFMWHTVIITGTEWENFFALRAEGAAEIHIQHLAYLMLEEYNKSTPKQLKAGEWHIPFGDQMDEEKIRLLAELENVSEIDIKIQIATARCAGVSYTVVGEDGKEEDYEKLIKRHDRLLKANHMSPFEHIGKAMSINEFKLNKYSGNFQGFIQYRKLLLNENKSDPRVIKK